MDLQTFINANQGKRPNGDIAQRWEARIVARGLQHMGEQGAQQYLRDYGKGIAAPKCIMLAVQAQGSGYPDMALGFWKKAYELETGQAHVGTAPTLGTAALASKPAEKPLVEDFPPALQPGRVATAQPTDATQDRSFYEGFDGYWGQPKIDGVKTLAFVAQTVTYQSRSMKLRESPMRALDLALLTVAQLLGPYIVEGELTYLDYRGGEHRTGAQAATVNIEAGFGEEQLRSSWGTVCR